MKKFIYLSVCSILALAACSPGFKKGDKGLEYKIIADGSGKTIAYGEFLQLHIKQIYKGAKDTVLVNSRDFMPNIQILDSINTPLEYFKILRQLRKGDSLVIKVSVDSLYKDPQRSMPPFMQKGKFINFEAKVINIFQTQQQVDSANKIEGKTARPRIFSKQVEAIEKDLATNKASIEKDSKIIEEYLLKNNIKAVKTKWGSFVVINQEGTGDKINNDDVVKVNYTGKTLDSGKVFDSNIDPKFSHVEPLEVNVGQLGRVILGWTDALLQLKKGSKATVYLPSALAYGASGSGENIGPNAILVFDMEVLDVVNIEAKMMQEEEQQKQLIEAEQKRADSIQNANKK